VNFVLPETTAKHSNPEGVKLATNNLKTHRTRLALGIAPNNAKIARLAANPATRVSKVTSPCAKCGRSTYFNVPVDNETAAWCGCE
jgi:hypothetical protein